MPLHHLMPKVADIDLQSERRFYAIIKLQMRAGKEFSHLLDRTSSQNKTYSEEAWVNIQWGSVAHSINKERSLSTSEQLRFLRKSFPLSKIWFSQFGLEFFNSRSKILQSFELSPGKPLETVVKLQKDVEILDIQETRMEKQISTAQNPPFPLLPLGPLNHGWRKRRPSIIFSPASFHPRRVRYSEVTVQNAFKHNICVASSGSVCISNLGSKQPAKCWNSSPWKISPLKVMFS